MRFLLRIANQILAALRAAETRHHNLLGIPLYNAAMRLLAGLLVGDLTTRLIKEWLWRTATC